VPTLISAPVRVEAAGNKPKLIDEYVGRLATGHAAVSVAHMRSPGGWVEPGQTPEFDEFTVVLAGRLRLTTASGDLDVVAGQAVLVPAGEWVRYSTPDADGAHYVAVCLPAFAPELAHRDPA
jgi:mannose-6-phosphate isomerase-like protein (cupin superfamily)